ncbi:MAG: leucine dehydrogenase [Actinomycetota bacterium]|jgi:leucine dehydrogenase|nr:leucine dehydrogenase [Actinomycetota bacterium]
MFEEVVAGWDGERWVHRLDEASGAHLFVAVHSTVLGPGMGGTRLKTYPRPEDGLADALRLSQAMTYKQAAAELPYGGGKAVIAAPSIPAAGTPERRDLFLHHADLIDSLAGEYVTAADMNTGPADIDTMFERTPFVLGRSPANGGSGDPGHGTAIGVFHGIKAAAKHAFGSDDLTDRTVLVQGVGSVGGRLAHHLHGAGAKVLLADTDPGRANTVAAEVDGDTIPVGAALTTACDIFAPCATGGVLNRNTIPRLACRVVAGAANNQLAEPNDGDRLAQAGILYAPDYVVNAGGVIHLAGYETLDWDEATMASALEGIARTLTEVFARAGAEGISTAAAADRLAIARIAAGRSRKTKAEKNTAG